MSIDIPKNVINDFIVQAVVESSIGDVVTGAIKRSVEGYDGRRAIEQSVAGMIRDHIAGTIRDDETLRDKVQSLVAEKLTDDVLAELVDKAFTKLSAGY